MAKVMRVFIVSLLFLPGIIALAVLEFDAPFSRCGKMISWGSGLTT
jgi:hypothetical protein